MLSRLPASPDANLVVGLRHPDDAAVYRMPGGDLLVQTVDLIAPIVDSPYEFGRIAATNALSDVYAMGGRPLTALNIVCFPQKTLPIEVLQETLRGACDVLAAAGCALVGGHSVADPEFKFGLSVSGVVDPAAVLSIDKAAPGDVLVLTKPLGTGVVNQAMRKDRINAASETYVEALRSMTTLNAQGAEACRQAGAHAATDVTGFGLLGHAAQFARASQVTFELEASAVPAFSGVREIIAGGIFAARSRDNRTAYEGRFTGLKDEDAPLLCDPQTSGGLLVALPEGQVAAFVSAMKGWPFTVARIGRVTPQSEVDVCFR